MTRLVSAVMFCFAVLPSSVRAAGLAHDANFIVLAPNQPAADAALAKANEHRRAVAVEWLGEELPPGVGQTSLHVEFNDREDRGLTWPIDAPGRTLHKVWIVSSPENALESTLRHEVLHVVLATQFPGKLPAWADEGAASQCDDAQRKSTRARTVRWYAQSGNWPRLDVLLQKPSISPADQADYSTASSLTEYLLTRGDRRTFLKFAVDGKARGWDSALQTHYRISDVSALQTQWQAWVEGGSRAPALTALPRLPWSH